VTEGEARRSPASVQMYPAAEPDISARFLVLRSGLRVRAVESGPRDGVPVLMLPGWASCVYEYRKTIPALAAAGYRAIAVDLKGHGLSDKPEGRGEYTLASMAAHALEILDALDIARARLVGHSLGGAIAAEVALRAPDRVHQLALIDPVGYGRMWVAVIARWLTPALVSPYLGWLSARRVVRLAVRFAWGRGSPTERDIDEYWAAVSQPGFVAAMRALVHEIEWSACEDGRLRRLAVPLLVLFGSEDRVVHQRALACYARDVPTARTVLIQGAGHIANEEAPDAVNHALLKFFDT
jgi:pimeloyl-ACP methyl ester carboxylesterase